MGKYDNYDYESGHAGHAGHAGHNHHSYDDRASVSEVYKTKEYHTAGPISSVHVPKASTFTIPCHHIRIGDLVILQHRPCQIIRITTSAQTGQHRYLGVDLFTKQLHEEPCVVSHPSPSVVLHSLLGPVFKQYRLIDIRDDGKLVAMTETGEIKQGLKVVDQGHLWSRLKEAFGRGSGSVRVLVISDQGKELAVDYKTVHLSHKL
jgi:translation elongation factor P/translation initiation factor 5A